ncbi:hypothetical protein HMPREF0476_2009 [Kingella kingae ATCC 23330]|uniref:Uncharacterized protein n=1 Tax=Kingella kingae ATCC 23330 TaxID=887327 RepID=F5S9X6_KINKI|nr:hypothetical protein HMPREF0476_2009 [Kingella kingae ATCC 23330]
MFDLPIFKIVFSHCNGELNVIFFQLHTKLCKQKSKKRFILMWL